MVYPLKRVENFFKIVLGYFDLLRENKYPKHRNDFLLLFFKNIISIANMKNKIYKSKNISIIRKFKTLSYEFNEIK